ncbi:hypothetical protein [Limosilactobacillus caviae]|uniref:Uncharacterized protein n=1 Tax=Limosilactobacillus caviae TaxID=1769424 RepID=A0ABQ2C5P8_9LACO|nr:hypothetical protein [Limosilactobacillus caviae]MCD7125036.1 hypothetical protein [Limosilactobacillus caviae]MRH45213.1 hypothetical protein [Limosilactobacillus reuteri]GGI62674.1 hypothetical protein GCM10011459_05080 [Limosilactobacillus caviae]
MVNFNKNDKATAIQSSMLAFLNSMVLTVFAFTETNANDVKGIFMATITVTIPLIMNVYRDDKKTTIVKQNFDTLFKKLIFSLLGVFGILMVIMFEWLMELISQGPLIVYLPLHAVKLFVSYLGLIEMMSLIIEPWVYSMLFCLDRNLKL